MTSITDISEKAAADITLNDLQILIDLEAPESDVLELKADLPLQKDARGWRHGTSLHRSERDGIAKEVIAFANTRGGRIFIGIDESAGHPKRASKIASPLPRLSDLVERLRDALFETISPPVPRLSVHGIRASSNFDEGYVVIDIPQTLNAPHGHGRPPACYWRRDSTSQPMEMTDLQNKFWEVRTRRERIEQEIQASSSRFTDYVSSKVLRYRFTLVSEFPMQIVDLTRRLRDGKIVPRSATAPLAGVAEYPLWRLDDWQYVVSGTEKTGVSQDFPSKSFRWAIDETGALEVIGNLWIAENSLISDLIVDAYDFTATAAHLLCGFRSEAGRHSDH